MAVSMLRFTSDHVVASCYTLASNMYSDLLNVPFLSATKRKTSNERTETDCRRKCSDFKFLSEYGIHCKWYIFDSNMCYFRHV